jgi:hypothetical protein
MRYLASLLLSLALLGTGPALAQIKKDVSEITGATRLVSKSMRSLVTESYPGHGSFRAEYENPPGKAPIWRLSFFGFAEARTEMTAASTVRVQADGQTLSPLKVSSRTRELEDSILEIKEATFPRADFERIATAQTVSVTMGAVSFRMTRPLRKDLRLILDRVPEGEGPQTASTTVDSSSNNQ